MGIGKHLKEARKTAGLSSEKSAEALKVARQTLNKYENDHVEPQASLLIRMADLYRCDINALLGRAVAQKPAPTAPAGIPVIGKIIDRTNFLCDFDHAPTERLSLASTEPDVYALRVVSNAMSPIVYADEHLIFKRAGQQEAMEITQDYQIVRGNPIGQILGAYRKKR